MFDETLRQDRIVGGSVALVENGRMVDRHDYGFADVKGGKRIDGDTIFHWASITKTLNAIGIMQLRDRGRLSLDDSLTTWVPELRRMHNPYGSMDSIKIYMVLEHSAGFQGSTWPYKQQLPWEPFEPTAWDQLVAMMPYQEIAFTPGSRFSYSNPSWIYLARAVEELTGDPWESYIQKNIFSPLGMSRSYFRRSPYYLREHRSRHYDVRNDANGEIVVDDMDGEFDPGITVPNGGWNSPLADAVTYIAFLTGAADGDVQKQRIYDTVLRRPTLEEMWRPRQSVADSKLNEKVGLAFFLFQRGAQLIIGNTGQQGGFTSMIYFNPQTRRGAVAAFNTHNGAKAPDHAGSFGVIREQIMKLLE